MRLALSIAALLLASAPAHAQTWFRAHGGADNAGFADVATSPVTMNTAKLVVSGVGTFAPGVGPVIARDGTAYLATLDGEVKAIATSGMTRWTAKLPASLQIRASPMVGSDGSIYVAGVAGPFRDHREGRAGIPIWRASLFRFSSTGALIWEMALPDQGRGAGIPTAPINGFGSDADEVILVPVQVLFSEGSFETRVLGYAPDGRLLFDQHVGGTISTPITGANTCAFYDLICWLAFDKPPPPPYSPPPELRVPDDARASPVSVAIAPGNVIVAADGHRGIRGYVYEPGEGLTEVFEKIDPRTMTSAVAAFPNERSVYAVASGRIAFSGPSDERVADIRHAREGDSLVLASATRLPNDWVVTVDLDGGTTIVENVTPIRRNAVRAQTIAAASASRNYYYVSTATELVTFDAATLDEVAHFTWEGGGLSSPGIGINGRVYAIAGGALYIFRNSIPARVPRPGRGETAVGSGCQPPPVADPR